MSMPEWARIGIWALCSISHVLSDLIRFIPHCSLANRISASRVPAFSPRSGRLSKGCANPYVIIVGSLMGVPNMTIQEYSPFVLTCRIFPTTGTYMVITIIKEPSARESRDLWAKLIIIHHWHRNSSSSSLKLTRHARPEVLYFEPVWWESKFNIGLTGVSSGNPDSPKATRIPNRLREVRLRICYPTNTATNY